MPRSRLRCRQQPACETPLATRWTISMTALANFQTTMFDYALAEMLLKTSAAAFRSQRLDVAVVGHVQPLMQIGELLVGLSDPTCKIEYYQPEASFYVHGTIADL